MAIHDALLFKACRSDRPSDKGYGTETGTDGTLNLLRSRRFDHLGSARMEFAGGGWPVWGEDYAPYGQEVSPTGAPEATSNIYKFTGYERDPETNIAAGTEEDYAQARYYSSAIQGRFMSPDPDMGSMDISNPQTMNRYTYANNNPLTFVDRTGLYWQYNPYDGCFDWGYVESGTSAGVVGYTCGGDASDPGSGPTGGGPGPVIGSDGSGGGAGGPAGPAPGPHYTMQDICAASAVLDKGLDTLLGAVGIVPGWNTSIKVIQGVFVDVAKVVPKAPAVALVDGFVKHGSEAVPIIGNFVSAAATANDLREAADYYDDCLAGKN